jgi:parvulin-like peptidyl-prolyl isomerase
VSVVNLLLEAHGVGVLEQLIALHAAEALAAKKELTVTAADVDFEYDLALRRLSDPLSSVTPATFDRRDAERLLDSVLAERNLSRGEFLLTLRRNAYLRRIVDAELTFTDEQLEAESNQAFGERVQIRHIQLGSAMDVARIQERIAAGEEFGELAVRYSANTGSARQRGLLDPFSAGDERLPALLRQVAFSLKPAEVSNVVRIGEWHHLLKLERRLAAEPRDLAASRGELEGRLRQREAEKAMRELYEKLLRETAVEIHDPILRGAFERKYPRRVP